MLNPHSIIIRITLGLGIMVSCSLAAQENTQAPPDTVEEITVTQKRPASLLRQEIFKATENVYALFNELNDDDEYDVHCYEQYILGSRIKQRFCHANFVEDALSDAAADYVRGQQGDPDSIQGAAPHLIGGQVRLKNRILEQKLMEFANSNKALNDALFKLKDLREEYEDSLE